MIRRRLSSVTSQPQRPAIMNRLENSLKKVRGGVETLAAVQARTVAKNLTPAQTSISTTKSHLVRSAEALKLARATTERFVKQVDAAAGAHAWMAKMIVQRQQADVVAVEAQSEAV